MFLLCFSALILFFFYSSMSFAVSWQPQQDKTIRNYRIQKSEPVYFPSWKEETKTTRSGGEVYVKKRIVNESVCFNYPEGSIEYRGCRKQARELFREKCDFYKEKYRSTKSPYNEDYKVEKDMFCTAGSTFQP